MTLYDRIYREFRRRHSNAPALFEEAIRSVYEAVLQPGDSAIDVGAHTGKHTFPMAECVTKDGRVIAFEPIWEKFSFLLNKVSEGPWSQIIAFNSCLFNESQILNFSYLPDDPGKSSINVRVSIAEDASAKRMIRSLIAVNFDEFFPDEANVKFIKIDAEGAEYNIVQGMTGLIERCTPIIHLELGEITLEPFGVKIGDVYELFYLKNYVFIDILGNYIDSVEAFTNSVTASGCYDYFAMPRETRCSSKVTNILTNFWGEQDAGR